MINRFSTIFPEFALKTLFISCFCLLFCFLLSCSQKQEVQQKEVQQMLVTDDLGRKVRLPERPLRLLPMASSMTEMLYAICPDSMIIARTQNCTYPEKVKEKPVFDNYNIDYEQLIQLDPDLVLTIDGITPPAVAARIEELNVPVYYQKYENVEAIFTGLQDLGKILNREEKAKQVVDSLRNELLQVQQQTPVLADSPSVLAITWIKPIYAYGQNTLFTDKLRLIGAKNAVQEMFAQPYPELTREYILQLNPDVLIGGTFEELDEKFFSQYPELRQINAYKNKRVYPVTDDLMSRPSPRVVQSVQELQNLIYK